jgi:hypothetical protein
MIVPEGRFSFATVIPALRPLVEDTVTTDDPLVMELTVTPMESKPETWPVEDK